MSLQNIVTLFRGLPEGQDQTFPGKKETKREERRGTSVEWYLDSAFRATC